MNRAALAIPLLCLAPLVFTGCETSSASRGAAMGAASGAVVAGPAGAAIGAAGGALVGNTMDERKARRAARDAAPVPAAEKYPVARVSATPGHVYSPYTDKLYDVSANAPGDLIMDTDVQKLFRRP
jgi:hypothetical protein